MRAHHLLPLLSVGLLSCTEYELTEENEANGALEYADTGPRVPPGLDTGPDDTQWTDTSQPVDEADCREQVFEAEDLDQVDACYVESETGTFTPVVEYVKDSWSVDGSSLNIMMTPVVASLTDDNGDGDIDEDDVPDILAITYGSYGTLRAISGDDGSEILNLTGHSLQGQGGIAVGDIDGDDIVEILAPTSSALVAFEHDGSVKWTSDSLSGAIYGTSDSPAISDMDGDGSPEIIIGSAILNADGSLRGRGAYGRAGVSTNVGTVSLAVDLDRDGVQEVVTGNALYDPDGDTIWYNGHSDGYVAVANFDEDDEGEIVVSGMAMVRLQDTDGTVLWQSSIPGATSSYYGGMPTVADYDGDGEPEVGVAANNSYTVFDTDGTELWQMPTQDESSGNTGSSVFDFEGDGVAEAVYADETRLWVFAGPDGSVRLESHDHKSNTWTEYPVIADVDADGTAEIVVANNTGMMGITVIGDEDDSWREGRRIWNQHAYHITNIEDDGTIPTSPDINWDSYNNFRSGDLTAATGVSTADLVVSIEDVCTSWCDEDRVWVWARVGNQGYSDATDVTLRLYADTPEGLQHLATEEVASVPAGRMNESIWFEFNGLSQWTVNDLVARVDGGNEAEDGGDQAECDESNNEVTWGRSVCQ